MADSGTDAGHDYKSLAKKRMIWALKPIGAVLIFVWILHPTTATNPDITSMKLQGFLVGALYGLIIYKDTLKQFYNKQRSKNTTQKNRVPEEYYMGHIEKVLRGKEEKEI